MTTTTAATRAALDEYRKQVNLLKDASEAFKAAKREQKPAKVSDYEREFLKTLFSREKLQNAVQDAKSNIVVTDLTEIDELDNSLRDKAEILYRYSWINLSILRDGDKNKTPDWWWQLDSTLVNASWKHLKTRGGIVQLVLSVVFIAVAVLIASPIIQTLFDAATEFVSSHIQEVGLEMVSLAAFVVQLLLSARIAFAFAGSLSREVNRWLLRRDETKRRIANYFLPINPVLVGSLLFSLILLGVVAVTTIVIRELQSGEGRLGSTIDLAAGREINSFLGEGSDYTNYTLLLGLQAEDRGDYEVARSYYREALIQTPSALVAYYRLSRLYLEQRVDPDKSSEQLQYIALDLLDAALRHVQESKAETDVEVLRATYALNSVENIAQMEFLLRVTRAEVFLNLGQPSGARLEIGDAEVVMRNNPQRFAASTEIEEPTGTAIPVTEFHYVNAKALTALWEAADAASAESYRSAALEAWQIVERLADPRLGRERLWRLEANENIARLRESS